jgi:hypothetical protein
MSFVWLEHALSYLQEREGLRLCQVQRVPDYLLKAARTAYRKAVGNICQILCPLHDAKLFVPGLCESCRAQGIDFASCDEAAYVGRVPDVWQIDMSYAMEFDQWVQAVDVMEDTFGDILWELNPDSDIILADVVDWLNTCIIEVIWIPGPDPTPASSSSSRAET